ncbi:hypothetical protein AUJ14_00915 [Candidatus Micrarchaeota archaeon CG1_02_55_22]|nr:MAG: hypothetical protein AUJ14_00915 [Candidatus Micrarchaeota archaeon CG1_02_55_22]
MDLGQGIRKALARVTGATLVDEATVKELSRDIQRALLANDVNVKLVFELTKRIERRTLQEKLPAGLSLREHATRVVYEELAAMMGEKFEPPMTPRRIMLIGLFGSGKTTTISKLAKFYQSRGLSVGVIAGDVHRPAAFEQLEQLSKQVGCDFYGEKNVAAEKVAKDGLQNLASRQIIILDTAGRSGFDAELASELKRMNEVFKPDDKYLVVSADIGQVAGRQAEAFRDAVGITGVIVTKMDGSGKGGGALSAVHASGAKIAFLGTGEKPEALEVFDAKKFVARLCGFPDLEQLLEKVKGMGDEAALQDALAEGKLDYNTFMAQMRAMKKMGPLKGIFQMMGAYDLPEDVIGQSERKMKQFEALVNSMTPDERVKPDLMKNSKRQERVARGAGVSAKEVKELVSNFEKSSKLVKGLRGNRGMMKKLGKMLPPGLKM